MGSGVKYVRAFLRDFEKSGLGGMGLLLLTLLVQIMAVGKRVEEPDPIWGGMYLFRGDLLCSAIKC